MVQNRSGGNLIFLALELQTSHLFDPNPSFHTPVGDPRVVENGENRFLSIRDIGGGFKKGDGLSLFLYEVTSETAEFRSVLSFTAPELRSVSGRIMIQGFTQPR